MDDPARLDAALRLAAAWEALRAAETDVSVAASAAHAAGVSWTAMGAAVGISRQSAHERWSQ